MGSSSSAAASPKVVDSVDIVVTQEVLQRWQDQQKLRQQQVPRSEDTLKGQPQRDQINYTLEDSGSGHSGGSEIVKQDLNIDVRQSAPENNTTRTPNVQNPSSEMPVTTGASSTYYNFENVDLFANLFVHKDSTKLHDDLESGSKINKDQADVDFKYGLYLREPLGLKSKEKEPDKTMPLLKGNGSGKVPLEGDENSTLGREPYVSRFRKRLENVRIPRVILPVVVDHDEDGKASVETITSWKMRQEMQKELLQNNDRWSNKFDKLTAKMEEETRRQAVDFEDRCEKIRERDPDIFVRNTNTVQTQCNRLATDIGVCYEMNQSQVLKCNPLVQKFAQCAQQVGGACCSTAGME